MSDSKSKVAPRWVSGPGRQHAVKSIWAASQSWNTGMTITALCGYKSYDEDRLDNPEHSHLPACQKCAALA